MTRVLFHRHAFVAAAVVVVIASTASGQPTADAEPPADAAELRSALTEAEQRIAALEAQVQQLVELKQAEAVDRSVEGHEEAASLDRKPLPPGLVPADNQPRSLWKPEDAPQNREKIGSEIVDAVFKHTPNVGYDSGFFIKSDDGNNLIKVRGFLAVRHMFNNRDGVDDEQVSGFEISRTRFGFMGHLIDGRWKYKIWTGDNVTGDNLLLDAWIQRDFGNGFSLTVGQFKLPFYREYLVSEVNLQFIERSLLSKAAAGGYTQGVRGDYLGDDLHLMLSINDGRSAINSSFHDDDNRDAEVALTGRAEWKLAGEWAQQAAFDSFRGSAFAAFVGAALHYQEENGDPDDEPDEWCWTVDALVKGDGWNVFVAGVGCESSSATKGDFVGFIAQGGFFVTDRVELIGRYEWASSDLDGVPNLSIASAGASVFFHRFNARFTGDVGYAFNPIDDRFDFKGAGYLVDTAGEDGQIVVRSQLQLLF